MQAQNEQQLKFELYRRIEFNSNRKRMSVLVRDPSDNKVKLYVKGADSIILSRLSENNDQ
jgi:magnesium-transporting ATPase (P-type)